MKIGIICEGADVSHIRNATTDNPDARVIERLIGLLAPNEKHELVFAPLGNKPNLKLQCGTVTKLLLDAENCDVVMIFWDLYPATWGVAEERKPRPCRAEDRKAFREALERAGISHPHVYLLCVEAELETLLLSDERALSKVLSSTTRPITLTKGSVNNGGVNPKKTLAQLFSVHKKLYNPAVHNPLIARAIVDIARLKKHPGFVRLTDKLRLAGAIV